MNDTECTCTIGTERQRLQASACTESQSDWQSVSFRKAVTCKGDTLLYDSLYMGWPPMTTKVEGLK